MSWQLPLGARPRGDGADFRVWAPDRASVEVAVYEGGEATASHPLRRDNGGYWTGHVSGLAAGTRYMYRLDSTTDRPDPASRHQPEGVHGPSMVVDPSFEWSDADWPGLPSEDFIVYELHVGTATPAGTFEALIERLPDLIELGITAIELMPVGDFPGDRNWGYDGVDLYAPARAYGGVEGLKRLVDAAHAQGLAVIQDVVYNHLGPAGNYLRDFSRDYFTHRHHTPWGDALNFDGRNSHGVREFFINNALYWAHEYHVDGLRLDATHAIIDDSPVHMLQELNQRLRDSLPAGRHFVIIAEDGRNEAMLARPVDAGGYGLDGIWADDFHHAVRVTLTGEHEGYYREYAGGADEIVTTLRDGWLYHGQPTKRTGEPRGTPAGDLSPPAFVHCIQNHDQIGNRALGERLNHDVPSEAFRAASALLLLSPYMPLLFMGQEWAASTPFLFFTDHDPELGRLITQGRRKEFKHFTAFSGEQVPDPQAVSTFETSKVNWAERAEQPHAGMWALYKDLIDLRKTQPACRNVTREGFTVQPLGAGALALRREPAAGGSPLLLVVNLRGSLQTQLPVELAGGQQWEIILDTEARSYSTNEGGSDSSRTATPFDGSHLMLDGPRALVLLSMVS